jgi:putative transposase
MARALRLEFEDALYHLCARGNRRERVFGSEKDYLHFEELLAESLSRYQVELHGYVLLGNHFHLLARTLKPNVSRWMHWLVTSYSVWFNRRHRMSGHVFQGRYKAFVVQEGEYLLGLSRYLHLNPVRGRVLGAGDPKARRERLRGYRWSSYCGYAGLAKQREFVTEELVLGEFSGRSGCGHAGKVRYRRFVEEGLLREIENPFEQVRWQLLLGNERFAQKMMDKLRSQRHQAREATGVRRGLHATEPNHLIRRVAAHYAVSTRDLVEERAHGSEPRNVAMWLLRQKSGLTLREIGSLFGGIDYAAVSERVRRVDQGIVTQKQLRKTCQILNI